MTGIYFNTDWQVEMFKRGKGNRHDTSYALISIYKVFLIFSVRYVVGTYWNQQHKSIHSMSMCFHHMIFKTHSQLLLLFK